MKYVYTIGTYVKPYQYDHFYYNNILMSIILSPCFSLQVFKIKFHPLLKPLPKL